MRKTKDLAVLKSKDIENLKNRPAINGFRDNLSLGAVLERAYITPRYHLHKHGVDCTGISKICNDYGDKNVIFVGDGGTGKTSAFLRLYMGADEGLQGTRKIQFYYFFAPDLIGDKRKLSEYQSTLRTIIESRGALDGILLLDGLEEAYANDGKGASERLETLNQSGITFWVSCRTSFYERLDDAVVPYFAERVTIDAWNYREFLDFIDSCLKYDERRDEIRERVERISRKSESLKKRPLFATMMLFVAESPEAEKIIHNEYELIEYFLTQWLERERIEKGIEYDREKCYSIIRDIALDIYLKTGKRPRLDKNARVFRDLLVMSNLTNAASIHGFSHREFLIYFIVNALVDAACVHPDKIVWWYSQTFYDDITNMFKPVLLEMDCQKTGAMFNNLFTVYRQTYENTSNIEQQMKELNLSPEKSFLKLRDEILYFILRLQNVDHEKFAQYAYEHSSDVMLFLGLAYGMAQIDPNNEYTLEFAKRLEPGTPEEKRNRGWGMCFFGDVEENGYTYDDTDFKPWNKIRENRLKRLSDDKNKYTTRVLDLPLLYCFYSSRGFQDCTSYKEYHAILEANTELNCFKSKQQSFMRKQKERLVSEYRKRLIIRELNEGRIRIAKIAKKGCISVNTDTKKVTLEVDDRMSEKILRQVAHRELVHENIKIFWNENGAKIKENYLAESSGSTHNQLSQADFEQKAKDCKVLIISANYIEGITITRRLLQDSPQKTIDTFPCDNQLYQFASIETIPVVHIWPNDTSSFTQYGSFCALDAALDRFSPEYVFSVGVAFGMDPTEQTLGDVLISKNFVPYDSFNKVTDGKTKLRTGDAFEIDAVFTSQLHCLETKKPPREVGNFKWYFGTMLTGGTVLSDVEEKENLQEAADSNGYEIIGGEMEASGVYYACQKIKGRKVPFMTVKGICDWGAEKNSWREVLGEGLDSNAIKDRIQALACDNAYNSLRYILRQLNMHLNKRKA